MAAFPTALMRFSRLYKQVTKNFDTKRFFKSGQNSRKEAGLKIGILGAPVKSGQRKDGVQFGPATIRGAGLLSGLKTNPGTNVIDFGDAKIDYNQENEDFYNTNNIPVLNPKATAECNKRIAEDVETILQTCDVCVTLGGDHSVAIGTISGHAKVYENICVLWVDAHPDLNSPLLSPSGNLHGMPLHFLTHELQKKRLPMPDFDWVKPSLATKNLGYIGIRDIDPGERNYLKRYNIPYCSIREVDRYGIAFCTDWILKKINPEGNRSLHLSFDIDSFDPSIAPATGTKVQGGLTYREGLYICEEVARTGLLRAMDLVEVNPMVSDHCEGDQTAEIAIAVLSTALGLSKRYV